MGTVGAACGEGNRGGAGALLPLNGFEVALQVSCGSELLENQGAFQSAADVLGFWREFGVVARAADGVVENPDQVADVVLDVFLLGRAPAEHINQLQVEAQAVALDDDVVGMQVAVVLAQMVDAADARGQRIEQVQRLERAEAPARLPVEELAEQLAFDVFGHQEGDGAAAEGDGLLGLILDDDRTGAQLVEFLGVPDQHAVVGIALGEEKLGGALDAGGALANLVDFAFPAAAQAGDDLVLAC